jgi:alkyl sulfatase BDS1-like metallo-beta-lactamase superfamily hydrolase
VYELTPRGYELEEVLIALGHWGCLVPLDTIEAGAELSVDAFVLALKTKFDAKRAGSLQARIELCVEGDRFRAEVADGVFTIGRGAVRAPDVVLDSDVPTLRAVLFDGMPLTEAARSRALRLIGDQRLAARFVTLFPRAHQAR